MKESLQQTLAGTPLAPPLRTIRRAYWRVTDSPTKRLGRLDDARLQTLLAFLLHRDANCVDIGAHEGTVLAHMRRYAPSGRHIAFEPVPESCRALRTRFPDADVRQSAVSDQTGTAPFVVVDELTTRSGLRHVTYPGNPRRHETEVQTVRLDEALPQGYVPAVIKIDVEGAEMLVLRGARDTLRRHRPVVVFEHQHWTARHYETGPDEVFDFLADDLQFRIYDLAGLGPYSREQFAAAYQRGAPFNFLARP